MKRLFWVVVIFMMSMPSYAQEQEKCSSEPKIINGVKMFQSCYCKQKKYPELDAIKSEYNLMISPAPIAGVDGYYVCGIRLRWVKKPLGSMEECLAKKQEVFSKIKETMDVSTSSAGFYCGRNVSEDNCIEEGDLISCANAQQDAERINEPQKAEAYKLRKCETMKKASSKMFLDKVIDCEGAEEYLNDLCKNSNSFIKEKACKALENLRTNK